MLHQETNSQDDATVALQALGWTLSDDQRAERFLALTGLTPDTLRGSAGSPAVLAGVIRFLEAHEPDLLACAEALKTSPAALVEAGRRLEG